MGKRYKPLVDKLFYIIWVPTVLLLLVTTAIALSDPVARIIMLAVDLFTFYFLVSPLFGYVELREETVFVKFGFIIKREFPYRKIKSIEKINKFYSYSMLSLKNSFEHIDIKYNFFDVISVSVVGNDDLIREIEARRLK